ncbi:putative carbohydrate-binding protein with CBM5 and CBM33 domain [Kitasatospora sp. GP30]|uniref:hypothetical protein n=1 Tax=Kitasatospora sp. GP30 TaxID=3035084 RepID=UPI000C713848|nr:hypothetical protein [Kitasatospora sp. GP30]MDH6145633.1 putative carbohydrate-binding protein with CBM5 and CBM33 domain [Kitasatospora sp. GP30]
MNIALRRTVATAVVVAGLVGIAAGTASAKSDVTLSVSTHTLRVGQSVKLTAWGDDDAARATYACIDQRIGSGAWHQLACSPSAERRLSVNSRAHQRGKEQFRVRLLASQGGHLVTDRISPATTVTVR